jgi:hypothetical protein
MTCLVTMALEKIGSRRVSQSFALSFAEVKFILSILCGTLRLISEPQRENKNDFLVSLRRLGHHQK